MNREIYTNIENLNDLVIAHANAFRQLQESMTDDIITYDQYIENAGRLSTYFLNAYDRITNKDAEDDEIIEDEGFIDPDFEIYDDNPDYRFNLDSQ